MELDLQIFMKRIWALSGSWGDSAFQGPRGRRDLGDALPIGPAQTFDLEELN